MRKKYFAIFIILVLMLLQIECLSIFADDTKIVFVDANFEKVIRSILNKPTGDILTSDAEKVIEINAYRKDISNIEGIQYFTNIKKLVLSNNYSIQNIGQIKGLKYLAELELRHTKITDISVLNTLPSLEVLDIGGVNLSSIDPNFRCNNLKKLMTMNNKIKDISGLSNCKNLEYLDLGDNGISNLAPLEGLTKLTYLDLYKNNISNINALANKLSLTELNIPFNNLTNTDSLNNLINLKSLNLSYNNIYNIDSLSKLANLTELLIDRGNNITDFKPAKSYYYALRTKDFYLTDKQIFDSNSYILEPVRYPVNINGTLFKPDKPLLHLDYSKKDFLYVPLQDISQVLGYELGWNSISSQYEMTKKDLNNAKVREQNIIINKPSNPKNYSAKPVMSPLYINGKKYSGLQPILSIEIDNIKYEYICLQGLCDIMNLEVTWNNDLKQMDIKYTDKNTILSIEKQLKSEFDYSDLNGNITIKGRITNINNEPIENASVIPINLSKNTHLLLAYKTNKNGEYIASGLIAGDYKIRVISDEGYKPNIIFRTLESNISNIDTQMQESSNEIEWLKKETNRFVIYYTEGDEVTDKEVQYQEEQLTIIESFLNSKVKSKIIYYLYPTAKKVREISGADAEAFCRGNTVTSPFFLHYHEIAHAVINAFCPDANNGIHEGLASFLSGGKLGSPIVYRKPLNDLAKELMKNDDLASIYSMLIHPIKYEENASFFTFLLKKYDLYQFKQLIKKIPSDLDFDKDKEAPAIDSAFWDIYGKTPFQMYNEWRVYLGGSQVANETDTFERFSVLQGTVDIDGLTNEDLRGKAKNLRTEVYKDINLTENVSSGVEDLYRIPQVIKLSFFTEVDGYLLIYADWNQNFTLDKDEYSAVVPVNLNYKNPMEGLNIILRKK